MIKHIRPRWERWLALAGFAYVILHFVYFGAIVADPGATVSAAARAFLQHPTQGEWGGTVGQATALALLLFTLGIYGYMRQSENEPTTMSALMLAVAVCAVVLTFISTACIFIDAHAVARLGDANLTYALLQLWWAAFLGAAMMTGLVAVAASALGLMTRLFPRWIGWFGIACGAGLTGACLAFYPMGGVVNGPTDGVAYLAENLMIIWIIAVSVVILRGRRVARSSTQITPHAEGVPV